MDELKNVKSDGSFVLEGCLDFVEESAFVLSAIDDDFNNLMESCGLVEDTNNESEDNDNNTNGTDDEAATNESTVVTEASVKEIGSKVVEFLKSIWKKIQDAFTSVVKWLQGKIAEFKSKRIDKVLDAIDKKNFKQETKLGKIYISDAIGDTTWMGALEMSAFGFDSDPEDIPGNVVSKVSGGKASGKDVSAMRKELAKVFLGNDGKPVEVYGANVKKVKDDVKKILEGGAMKAVKDAYNAARKNINDLIAKWKSQKKDAEGEQKKEIGKAINHARRCGQLLYTGVVVQFNCIRKQYTSCLTLAMRIKTASEKKEEKTNEAVDIFAW